MPAPRRWSNTYSFESSERLRAAQQRDQGEGDRACARGEHCAGKKIILQGDERTIVPARTSRPFCLRCESHIVQCARELPAFYLRLAFMLGDPAQSSVAVRSPFGPQTPVREDVDAHMRLMAALLAGWDRRVRIVKKLTLPDPDARHDTVAAVQAAAGTLVKFPAVMFALDRAWTMRAFRWPVNEELTPWLSDCEIVRTGEGYGVLMIQASGEDAGREVQYLHHRARSILLETNPPVELLVMPCRECTHRTLRRAWADSQADLYSKCDRCGDEMTQAEYDANAKRWTSYYRAHQRAKLAETAAA